MADRRKYNRGHVGKAGRKPKCDEQKLIELLTPLSSDAYKALENAIKEGESWAVKLWFEYMYGKPKQMVDLTTNDEPFEMPVIKWID